jgi:PAS domain S-box-containing protein
MDIFNNLSSNGRDNHSQMVRGVLLGVALAIILILGIIIYFYFLDGVKTEIIIMGIGILPILGALELARKNHLQVAGSILVFALTLLVTILATVGQGINDVGIMAFPVILLISSMVLRREITISVTIFMIVCCGWLVFGDYYKIYHPFFPPQDSTGRAFVITSLILIFTSTTVQYLSGLIQKNHQTIQSELQERKSLEKDLKDAETLYRALVEQTSVVVYRDAPNANGDTIYISPQIETLLGYTMEEWKKDPVIWKNLTHPDDLPEVLANIASYITTGEPSQIEYRMRTKSGFWKWVRDDSVVVKDETGKPQYIHGVLIDITERKEAEENLKQREAILSAVAYTTQRLLQCSNWQEEVPNILARLGVSARASHVYIFENHPGKDSVLYASMKYEWTAHGIKPDIDNPAYQNSRLIPPPGMEDWFYFLSSGKPFYGSANLYPRYWKRVFEERGLKTLLEMPIFVNGQWWGIIGFDDYVYELPWSQAEIDALVAAAGNLGTAIERQEKVHELRVSEEKFHLAFHHTYVAMAITRANDHILYDVNESFCKITGYSREKSLGKRAGRDLNIWVNQDDRNYMFDTLVQQGYVDEHKAKFRRRNGEVGTGLVSAVNITVGGEPCHLFSFYDISKIEQLLDELKAKNEELQNFTYTVSHDLKAPLVTIAGFLGYLEQDARKGDLDRLNRDVLRINEAVTKMQRLLSELLELSRIGRLMNPPEMIPFEEIVRDALGMIEGRLQERQVQVQVEPGLPSIYGDRVRLVEVIQNLVDNAARFMGDQSDPTVEIGVRVWEDKSAFFVRDNGMGIEPEYHERIFGLFNKLDAHTEGTGIGLALVKRIVEVHGGKIWVESEGKGQGSTFYFTLADRPTTGVE